MRSKCFEHNFHGSRMLRPQRGLGARNTSSFEMGEREMHYEFYGPALELKTEFIIDYNSSDVEIYQARLTAVSVRPPSVC